MTTSEERIRILNMVEEGKLTPEEAARMLTALAHAGQAGAPPPRPGNAPRARFLHIHIEDPNSGRGAKINMRLPIRVVGMQTKVVDRYAPPEALQGMDVNELWKAVEAGEPGRIVDIHSEDGEIVAITLE